MKEHLTIGFSPCPNDTHIFCALMHGWIPLSSCTFSPEVLADVEQLNEWAMAGKFDVTKLSFHALGHVLDRYVMLDSGAALGRGCGPLLVAATPMASGNSGLGPDFSIAIPGRYTTASLLLQLYAPRCQKLVVMPFDQIMPAVAAGQVDGGLIIHESRFTFQQHGLHLLVDLGSWWEQETGLPIPLGCIAARRSLDAEVRAEIEEAIRRSILYARRHPAQCASYIRTHAQEMDPEVMESHIDLYVNDFSLSLGKEGNAAVQELFCRARDAGVFAQS